MKKLGVILVVAVLCCGFIPQHKAARQQMAQRSVSELYSEAIKHSTIHHDTLATLTAIEAIFQQDSTYAPALNLLSRITREPKKALVYSERAYLSDTTNRYYLEGYGGALIRAGEYQKAVPIFEKMVQNSTEPDHYRILAILLDGSGRRSEAIAVLDTAEVRFGRIPHLCRIRQYFYLRSNRPLEAEAEARKAVEEAPYIAENHISLAEVYAATRRDSLALVSFQNAIAIDTTAIESWAALAEFYQKRNQQSAYLSILERLFGNEQMPLAAKIAEWRQLKSDLANYRRLYPQYDALIKRLFICHPSSNEVADLYAEHLISSGNIKEALRLYKKMIDYEKPQLDKFLRIIEIEGYLEHPDSVKHYATLAIHAFPRSVQLLQMQSMLASQEERYDDAKSHLQQALEYAENDTLRSSLLGSIGDIEHQRNNMKQCYKCYDKALRLYADNAMVLNNYAYFLSLEGRQLERALTMASRAIALSENNSTYLDTMAWVLYKLGRYAEAKKYMQQALSLDRQQSAELMLHYGDILHALGEEFMAKTYWRKALERGADKEEIEKRVLPAKSEPQKKR